MTGSDRERLGDLRRRLVQMPRRPGEVIAAGSDGQQGWYARCSAAVRGSPCLAAELTASLAPGQDASDARGEVRTWPGEPRGGGDLAADGPLLSAARALLDVVLAVEDQEAAHSLLGDAIARWRRARLLPPGVPTGLIPSAAADPRVAHVLELPGGLAQVPEAGYAQLVLLALAGELQPTMGGVHVSVVFGNRGGTCQSI